MSKKVKTQMRKMQTRAVIEKKRAKKAWAGESTTFSMELDHFDTADHFSYEDMYDLMGLPERYSGKV